MKLFIWLAALAATLTAAEFHVSPAGSDENPGTDGSPFRTLERARLAMRAAGPAGSTVWLHEGIYRITRSFGLVTQDSGTPEAPATWRAWPGDNVRIIGGAPVSAWEPAEGRDGIWVADLAGQGITDFGRLTSRGASRTVRPAALELFFEGRAMRLARWPNRGWAIITATPAGQMGGRFTVDTDRLSRWVSTGDIWLHGYWTYDWADSYEHVAAIDPERGEIRTDPPHGIYGYLPQHRFRVLNVLEELDEPGEWYLDRSMGVLYFWPPAPIASNSAFISLLEGPLFSLRDASHVHLRDLVFEITRGNAVEITGGEANLVRHCTIRNTGNRAVVVSGGKGHGVAGCEITATGDGALLLAGGDRATLTPAGHFATSNHIHDYSRWVRTYRPASQLAGVGNIVSHNLIHHAPHQAILLAGNDHVIEYNDIHTVAIETSDVGAFYMGRDWTERGNIIRGNFFHNLGNAEVSAVYLDDFASGARIEGNVFQRARRTVFLAGGRDNLVRNNLFIDSEPGVEADARGTTWAAKMFDGRDTTLFDRLRAVPFAAPPWSERYPALVNILEDEPALPKGNAVERNVSFGGVWTRLRDGTGQLVRSADNFTEGDPGFLDYHRNDFRLRDDSPAYLAGFQPIRWDAIGIDAEERGGFPPTLGVIHGRIEVIRRPGSLAGVRVVVENRGRTPAAGQYLLWVWPERGLKFRDQAGGAFDLEPGGQSITEFEIEVAPGMNELHVGLEFAGEDLSSVPVRIAVR